MRTTGFTNAGRAVGESARSRRAGAVRRAAVRRRSNRGSRSRGSRATRTRTARASRSCARATGSRSFAIAPACSRLAGSMLTFTSSSTRAPSTSRTSRSSRRQPQQPRRGRRARVAAMKRVLVLVLATRSRRRLRAAPYDYTIDPAPLYSKRDRRRARRRHVGAASVYAYFAWFRHATRTTDPMFTLEGFGVNTYAGGADKLGHFWAGHMFSYVTTEALVHGGFRTLPSSIVALWTFAAVRHDLRVQGLAALPVRVRRHHRERVGRAVQHPARELAGARSR